MRLSRFYTERKKLRIGSSIKLNDSDLDHVKKVLRLKKGDPIILFNGEKEFEAKLLIVGNKFITAKVTSLRKETDQLKKDNHITLVLFQSLLRAGKFDSIIEKTTEIGIDSIVPVETEFSQSKLEVVSRKLDRWNKVAIAASKQSERIDIPEITEGILFREIEKYITDFDLILFFTIPREKIISSNDAVSLKDFSKDLPKDVKKVGIFIGAEGGFSPNEHIIAKNLNFKFIKLGDTILRSETAAVVITGIVQYIFNN